MSHKRVIVVTDGDCRALEAVQAAARNIGARCISLTGCRQPGDAYLTPEEVAELIRSAEGELVVVLVDDEGRSGAGWGEQVTERLVAEDGLEVIGAVAVASDERSSAGVDVDSSVTREGQVIGGPVDKEGRPLPHEKRLFGDTVDALERAGIGVIVGLGDPGKMDLRDDARKGAPLTTQALQEVLRRAPGR